MIYTITFNPAIDYVIHTADIKMGAVNRTSDEKIYFGGKGINVSIVLNELGVQSKALGFIAGFTGKAIEDGLSKQGISTDFVHLENGYSRINVKIKSAQETEINGQGPQILDSDIEKLFKKLDSVQDGDTVVLAGSIPNSLPNNIYERIFEHLKNRKVKMVVDTTKDLLMKVLKYKPFLIKPNNFELSEIFGKELSTFEEVSTYAKKLKDMGATNVLVSMAGDGAVLIDENNITHTCGVCKGTVKNSVGAGDSMLAGFIVGSVNGDYGYALKLGTATGGATAFSNGLATKDEIFTLLRQLI
jgi:1-phosphofructokinase